jgi:ABC-type Mn2+/Zn2+ transport system ATPase subunit
MSEGRFDISPHDCRREHVLEVSGLCVSYGRTAALREVSFRTECGGCLGLIGPNGAGKTTLLKVLAGLVRKDHGSVWWRGKELKGGSVELAYLPQRSQVDWNFPATVRRVVEMGRYPHLGWWRPYGRRDREAVDEALALMGLEGLEGRQIGALSGGQQQRTFLARALAQEAHVLLLDEPFTGLDASATEGLAGLLGELAGRGHLVVASHHDLENVREVYDRVMLLAGRVVAYGATEEVFTRENLALTYAGSGAMGAGLAGVAGVAG